METKDARALVKQPGEVVKLVIGHPVSTGLSTPSELMSTGKLLE